MSAYDIIARALGWCFLAVSASATIAVFVLIWRERVRS